MSNMSCVSCKKGKDVHQCDRCQGRHCEKCLDNAGMSATEIRVLQLKSRKLMFMCPECARKIVEEISTINRTRAVVAEEMARIQEKNELFLVEKFKVLEEKIAVVTEIEEKYDETLKKLQSSLKSIDSGKLMGETTGGTYASIVRRERQEPVLVVKPKNEQKSGDTKKEIREKIDPVNLGVGISQFKEVSRGQVVIKSGGEDESERLKKEIESKMSDKYEVKVSKLKNPRIKLYNIDKEIDSDNEEIEELIINQNKLDCKKETFKLKIVKKLYSKKYTRKMSLIIEVDPETHENMLGSKKMYIGWQVVGVENHLDIIRCFKCLGYGHFAKECKNKQSCFKCDGEHDGGTCSVKEIDYKCVNCIRAVTRFNVNIKTDHSAFDKECPCYLRIVRDQANKVNYGI